MIGKTMKSYFRRKVLKWFYDNYDKPVSATELCQIITGKPDPKAVANIKLMRSISSVLAYYSREKILKVVGTKKYKGNIYQLNFEPEIMEAMLGHIYMMDKKPMCYSKVVDPELIAGQILYKYLMTLHNVQSMLVRNRLARQCAAIHILGIIGQIPQGNGILLAFWQNVYGALKPHIEEPEIEPLKD